MQGREEGPFSTLPSPREEPLLTQALHSSVAEASVTAGSAQSRLGYRLSLPDPLTSFQLLAPQKQA